METADSRRKTIAKDNDQSQVMNIMTHGSLTNPDTMGSDLEMGLKISLVNEVLCQFDGESKNFC